MEFDHNNVRRRVAEEDRLSSLPDELIHKILSCFDMKFAVQTSLLSSRWEFLWTSMPCLNFSSWHFNDDLHKFAKFVTHVLSHRNHQIEVASVELIFYGTESEFISRKIADYAFSHNIQELTVIFSKPEFRLLPQYAVSHSQSLKHFTFRGSPSEPCLTPITTFLDFPALTTLHLSHIILSRGRYEKKSVDLFSKCVNLKNLTLEYISGVYVEVFDIIAPRLEKLTVIDCSFKYLNAPPGLSSLYYSGYRYCPLQLCKDRFHSLNNVTIRLFIYCVPYEKEYARNIIKMLQELHSVRYLTLGANIIECISSFPDMLSHHPSPFSNLICLTINSRLRKDGCPEKMSTEARNFFFENSPNATLISKVRNTS